VVMVQQEVAWRLAAPVGDSERGLVSLEVEAFADAELLLTVPPRCFSPPPKVVSAVVRLALRPAPAGSGEIQDALALAAEGFCHRRKKLHNALGGGTQGEARRTAAMALGMGDARPQDLTLADWLRLALAVREAA
jgi:16S rRNA (adenine1518-N6/adenine1519-N6)-dimethyltransferase